MRRTNTALYAHIVWGTWDRLPYLTGEWQAKVYASILAKCRELEVEVLAIGGIEDHVHLLVCMPAKLFVATLVNQIKGGSSHLINNPDAEGDVFKWQGGYGAFSVSPEHVPLIRSYVQRQEEHHRLKTTNLTYEYME